MHYLIISSEFPPGPGGIGKHAYCMAKALMNNGISVSVVCNMDHADETEIEFFLGELPESLNVYRIKRNGILTYTNRLNTIFHLVKENNFDKIIATGQFSIWVGGLLKLLNKERKLAAFVHGTELLIGGGVKRFLTKYGLQKADEVYAVSNYTADLTRKLIKRTVSVLPNGLDINEWDDEPVNTFKWNGYPSLLTVGSITPRKGQHNMINALPRLIEKYPDVHYHMVGLPVDKERIFSLAKELDVAEYISFHGKLNNTDMKAAYQSADVFVMLSEQLEGDVEGFGIAILEANIMGVPAIGSKGSGIEDAIKDGYNGYLVNNKDGLGIATAVDKILTSDKEMWKANCREWALQHDWNKLAKALL